MLSSKISKEEYKKEIEAILFASRRIVHLEELCREFPNMDKTEILGMLYELIEEYLLNGSALEIVELSDSRFELTNLLWDVF